MLLTILEPCAPKQSILETWATPATTIPLVLQIISLVRFVRSRVKTQWLFRQAHGVKPGLVFVLRPAFHHGPSNQELALERCKAKFNVGLSKSPQALSSWRPASFSPEAFWTCQD